MAESKQETVDFAYAIDCTGSMGGYITQVRQDIGSIVSKMQQQYPEFKLRLGCVAYRDWCDNEKRLESLNFVESVSSFKQYVEQLQADGGGDEAEDVLGGLRHAVKSLSWNSKLRVLFHICDAPPHNKMYHDTSSDDYPSGHSSDPSNYHEVVLREMKHKHIHLCVAKLNDSVSKMISVFKNYGKSIELTIEERSINNASELLSAVQQTLHLLTKMRQEVKGTQSAVVQVTKQLNEFKIEASELVTATMKKMDDISADVTKAHDAVTQVERTVSEAKREYDGLVSSYSVLKAYANSVNTPADIVEAETKVMQMSVDLTKVNESYSAAQTKLDDAFKRLTEKSSEMDTAAKTTSDAAARKIQIKNEICSLITKVGNMERSEERKQLKKDIKEKLAAVNELFKADAKMKAKILTVRMEILKAFKEAQNRSTEIRDAQTEVESKLRELDSLLDELDERE